MPPVDPKYDVAISFLSPDLNLAEAIRDQLRPDLTVFVYSRNQEEVAGKDGLDQFHQIFRYESRLNVVLYRDGWGETPWTGVEENAIKGSALHSRFRSVFIVQLEKKATLPRWVPETLITMQFADFGITETVGAIRRRAIELDAKQRVESTVELARRLEQEADERRRRRSLEASDAGLQAGLRMSNEVTDAAEEIGRAVLAELQKKTPFERTDGTEGAILNFGWISLHIDWDGDSITQVGATTVRISCWQAQSQGGHSRKWIEVSSAVYESRLAAADDWKWRDKKGRDWSPTQLSDAWMKTVVRLELGPPRRTARRRRTVIPPSESFWNP